MLLLRSFFLLAAAVEARPPGAPKSAMLVFSLSVALEGEKPEIDLRVRRVAGCVSCEGCDAIVRWVGRVSNKRAGNEEKTSSHNDDATNCIGSEFHIEERRLRGSFQKSQVAILVQVGSAFCDLDRVYCLVASDWPVVACVHSVSIVGTATLALAGAASWL